MVVLEDRRRLGQRVALRRRGHGGIATRAFPYAPSEILAARTCGRDEVDLLALALADIAQEEIAGQPVERHAPRVAQAIGEDFGEHAGDTHEWIVGGNRVRRAAVDVDAQELPEQRAQRLAAVERIVAAAAVAMCAVEIAVGTEQELAAVVIRHSR